MFKTPFCQYLKISFFAGEGEVTDLITLSAITDILKR